MQSMKLKAFLDVSSVEITFSGPDAQFGRMGPRVVARVNIHQSVGGAPYVHANPHTMALSWAASSELVDKVKELIEAEGFTAILGGETEVDVVAAPRVPKDAKWHAEHSGSDEAES